MAAKALWCSWNPSGRNEDPAQYRPMLVSNIIRSGMTALSGAAIASAKRPVSVWESHS